MIGFPLLLIPLAIYNMIAFLTPGVSWTDAIYPLPVPLKSGGSGTRNLRSTSTTDTVDWKPTQQGGSQASGLR